MAVRRDVSVLRAITISVLAAGGNAEQISLLLKPRGKEALRIIGTLICSLGESVEKALRKMEEKTIGILRCISGGQKVVIKATKGTEQIWGATKTFPGGIDSKFTPFCHWKEESTEKTLVEVYELTENGDFRRAFGSFKQNFDRLCLTRAQIRTFVETNSEWLSKEGNTSFLFKEDNKFFVFIASFDSNNRLNADLYPFSEETVWNVVYRHRFVVPQVVSYFTV